MAGFDKILQDGYLPGSITTTNSNQFILVSTWRGLNNIPPRDNATVVQLANDGSVIHSKKFTFPGMISSITDNQKLRDGNFLFVNNLLSNDGKLYVLLHKYDSQLNTIWTKTYNLPFNFPGSFDLAETSDGNLYFQYSPASTAGNGQCLVAKFDAAGNFIWCRTYLTPSADIIYPGKLVESGDDLYFSYGASQNGTSTIVTKIEKTDGDIVWSKSYSIPGRHVNVSRQMDLLVDNIVLAGSFSPNFIIPSLLMIDKDGVVKQSVTLNGLYTIQAFRGSKDEMVLSGKYFLNGGFVSYYITTDAAINPKYGLGNIFHGFSTSIDFTNTGSIIETGFATSNALYLKKHPPQTKMGMCDSLPVSFSKVYEPVVSAPVTITKGSVVLTPASPVFSITDGDFIPVITNCTFISDCNTLKVSGINKVCNTTDTYTYKAIKNVACTLPVEWVYDKTGVQTIAFTDSTITVKFLSGGSFKIKSRLLTGCESAVEDSITVNVSPAITGINLGADKTLCNNSMIKLSAGPHFQSYRWQDGSRDSTFTVTTAGKYYVVVKNACDNEYSDTINVMVANTTAFDIGSDIITCKNDTVAISAPAGYAGYSWTPANNTQNNNGQVLLVSPSVTTRYYVNAINQIGCSVSDSILVTVRQPGTIQLPDDTSICSGQTILLAAGAGFKSYRWSTSESTEKIVVNKPGIYSVSATDSNNCISRDTFKLVNVYALPVVHLGNDTAICIGSSFNVNAGSFSSYRWQDNSTGNKFSLSQPGKHFVTVSDVNGCTNSDTIIVTGYKSLPVDFLPARIEFCQDEPVELKTNSSYVGYRWNNGSTASYINITSPGMYTVEVTNADGCKNTDTTYAAYKDCYKLVYFPTAFSPNNDGKNDVFKPTAYGTFVKFRLTVFNRYGSIVFDTTDPSKGWDGRIKGMHQNTQTFIWTSSYLFTGADQTEKIEKGTILLLR